MTTHAGREAQRFSPPDVEAQRFSPPDVEAQRFSLIFAFLPRSSRR